MKREKERHYLDACIFIAFINQNAEINTYQECLPVIQAAERREIDAFTSTISLSEVTYVRGTPPLDDNTQEKIISQLFESPWLNFISFEPVVAQLTRKIARRYGRSPLDNIHLASALRVRAQFFHTLDQRLINALPQGVSLPPEYQKTLIVQRPTGFQTELDFNT